MKAELDVNKTVKKSNILNELRNANASLVEYRLFCVYLAHLSLKSEDNIVTFSLADYARIAGLDRPRYNDLKVQANNMVGLTATLPSEDGGFSVYSLFSQFKLFREDEQWLVSLECNPQIAPLIREQKGRFLRYKLYNTIYLKSYNQQRIYELLKQYETIGSRLIKLEDLRAFLGIGEKEYPVWYDFSSKVLKVAQRALKESTDICFEYEPVKKGRPVVAVKFTILKNKEFVDLMEMDKFLPAADASEYEGKELVVRAADDNEEDERDRSNIELFRSFLGSDGKKFSDAQIREQREAARASAFADSLLFKVMANQLDVALGQYIKAQYLHSLTNAKKNLHSYFVLSLRGDYAGFYRPEDTSSSFDVEEFSDLAVKASMRD